MTHQMLLTPSAYHSLHASGLIESLQSAYASLRPYSAESLIGQALNAPLAAGVLDERDRAILESDAFDSQELFIRYAPKLMSALLPDLLPESVDPHVREAAGVYLISDARFRLQRGDAWAWRNGERLQQIQLHTHGDVSFVQYRFDERADLFPAIVAREYEHVSFGLRQDASPLLITLLLYARAIGAEQADEIVHHQEIIQGERVNPWGTPVFDRCRDEHSIFSPVIDLERPLFRSDGCPEQTIPYYFVDAAERMVLPALKESALEFWRESSSGECSWSALGNRRFEFSGRLEPSDLGDALRGTYRAFARDPYDMVMLLKAFTTVGA